MSEFDNIFQSIKTISLEHIEPYKDGSWEKFVQLKRKKNNILLWPLILTGLAASIITATIILPELFFNKTKINNQPNTHTSLIESNEPEVSNESNKVVAISGIDSILISNSNSYSINELNFNHKQNNKDDHISHERFSKQEILSKLYNNYIENDKNITLNDTFKESIQIPYKTIHNNEELMAQSLYFKEDRKLSLGALISPLIVTNKDGSYIGISAGIQTYIPINRIMSLNTGLLLSHQKVDVMSSGQLNTNNPVSLTTKLTTFDIPFNIKLTLKNNHNKEAYLIAGLSSIGYLNEQNKLTYKYEEVVKISTSYGEQNYMGYQTIITEKTLYNKVPAFTTFDLAGFMNLSFGIKRSFHKNKYICIEPYMKVPLTELNSNNIKYFNGGLNFIISK